MAPHEMDPPAVYRNRAGRAGQEHTIGTIVLLLNLWTPGLGRSHPHVKSATDCR